MSMKLFNILYAAGLLLLTAACEKDLPVFSDDEGWSFPYVFSIVLSLFYRFLLRSFYPTPPPCLDFFWWESPEFQTHILSDGVLPEKPQNLEARVKFDH